MIVKAMAGHFKGYRALNPSAAGERFSMQSGDFRRRGDIQKEVAATWDGVCGDKSSAFLAATRFSSDGDMQAVTSGDKRVK